MPSDFIHEMRAYREVCINCRLSADAQLLYVQLFLDANAAFWPEELPLHAREYSARMEIPVRRIRRALDELGEIGLVHASLTNTHHQWVILSGCVSLLKRMEFCPEGYRYYTGADRKTLRRLTSPE